MNSQQDIDIDFIINEIIDGWITNDIRNMMTFEPNTNLHYGRLGCPLVFAIVSSMSLIGYLLRNSPKTNAEDAVSYYVETFLNKRIPDPTTRKELAQYLTRKYRHMVNHHFIPRAGYGITKTPNDPRMINDGLNVSILGELLIESLDDVKREIVASNNRAKVAEHYQNLHKDESQPGDALRKLSFPDLAHPLAAETIANDLTTSSGTHSTATNRTFSASAVSLEEMDDPDS